MENERQSHPSYAQLSFSRINGRANFYGSELTQDNYIEMTLLQSEVEKDLTAQRYFASSRKPLVKLRLSAIQHKITTLGLQELHKQNNLLSDGK